MHKIVFYSTINLYATFKIEGNNCRFLGIIKDEKVYRVPPNSNVHFNKESMNYLGPANLKFDEAIEEIIEICERYEIK